MASRSCSTRVIGGTTKVPMTASTMRKMASTKKKVPLGTRKLLVLPPSSAAWTAARTIGLASPITANYFTGVANTNNAINARLMKYAASTNPTVMKNGVNNRPCASGCRAIPETSALPATPSPIPAPIAPPPMIRPPPMRAPGAIVGSILASFIWGYLVAVYQASVIVRGPGQFVAVSVMILVHLHSLAEVQDGQNREDEGLDRPHEQVERFPDRVG